MLDHQHRAARIDVEGLVPNLDVHIPSHAIAIEQFRLCRRAVVEHHFQLAIMCERIVDQLLYAVGIAQIDVQRDRSEEHTSELQSLMRISYAVFCLKKIKCERTPQNITR